MATHSVRLRRHHCHLEPGGLRPELGQPSGAAALWPHRRTAATPPHLGPGTFRPAQARSVAGGAGHHRVPELCPALVAGQVDGHGPGLRTGGGHLLLGHLRHRLLAARRPPSPPRPAYSPPPGVPPTVADRQLRRLRRGDERPAHGQHPGRSPGPYPGDSGQYPRRAVFGPVHPAFPAPHRPPDPQPAPVPAADAPGLE